MNTILGQFIPVDSIIHRLDPRTKMIIVFFSIIVLFVAKTFWSFIPAIIFVLLIMALSNVGFGVYFKGLRTILFLLIFSIILQLIFTDGQPVYFQWWIFRVTGTGLYNSAIVVIRLILIVLMTTVLTATTKPTLIASGLESILNPLKKIGVPVATFAMMMSIALRSIPILNNQLQKIIKAQQSRGINFSSGGLITRIKNVIPLIIPMFVGSINQAFDLADSMIVRGFVDADDRTRYRQLKYQRNDIAAFLIFVAMAFLVIVI